ncbi:MAG: restriction endonuclease subunit S [Candidatus Thiodiazotropha lotti]|uniref:Restriction endonuclease subunit S n=1 Tax=Candidatus Thiodiazotropha lotti TaxID=2792787 RepID=A0A9E4K5U9_9GAMM|nr:restriction endonuclease subunit S [Candidatus Thiodiazotropha lotti]MCG7939613.1 restriction endonuclease subunit S [Candidatus Thiodiazotropha lotti]MCW4204086.1 restriction endonuclease subunit S [Candidatus Thiodiazotropha lotti]MCW4222468.1 restriction endonuclease subunit S [Candidatus Thiodiazotropha lotti]
MNLLADSPQDWIKTSVGKYCDVQLGKMLQNDPASERDELKSYLRAINIAKSGLDLSHEFRMWIRPQEANKFRLEKGDILVSEGGDAGRTAVFNVEEEYYFQNAINRVRPNHHGKIEPEFIYYWFTFLKVAGYVEMVCNVATIAHFTAEKVKAAPLVLPPLKTQQRIAQFLDEKTAQIDGLIEKKRALLERLAEKRQALITRAVTKGLTNSPGANLNAEGGPKGEGRDSPSSPDAPMKPSGIDWLGDIPEHWEVLPLRRILNVPLCNGLFKRKSEFGEGALLVNVFDVYRSDLKVDYSGLDRVRCDEQEVEKYSVINGDIFFVRSSLKMQGIAVAAIAQDVPEDTVFECHLVRARCRQDRMFPRFLSFVLASNTHRDRLVSLAKTTTMTTLAQESLNSLHVTVPPLKEQIAIAHFVEQEMGRIKNLGGRVEHSIDRLTEYRSALITAAVTGQISGLQ